MNKETKLMKNKKCPCGMWFKTACNREFCSNLCEYAWKSQKAEIKKKLLEKIMRLMEKDWYVFTKEDFDDCFKEE